jgi:hypothetical protein
LHLDSLAEISRSDFLTIHFSSILAITGAGKNGINTRQRKQRDNDPDDGFGNPTLLIVPDILQHASPRTTVQIKQSCSVGKIRIEERRISRCAFS